MTVPPYETDEAKKRAGVPLIMVVFISLVAGAIGGGFVAYLLAPSQPVAQSSAVATTLEPEPVYSGPVFPVITSATQPSSPETTDAPLSPPPGDEPTSTGSENPAPSMESDPASIPPVVATNFVPSATAVPTSFVFCDILWTTPDQQFWLIKTQTGSLLISIDDADGMHFGEAFQANVMMLTSSVGTINEAPSFVDKVLPNRAGIC